jgi:hypothetical protein
MPGGVSNPTDKHVGNRVRLRAIGAAELNDGDRHLVEAAVQAGDRVVIKGGVRIND